MKIAFWEKTCSYSWGAPRVQFCQQVTCSAWCSAPSCLSSLFDRGVNLNLCVIQSGVFDFWKNKCLWEHRCQCWVLHSPQNSVIFTLIRQICVAWYTTKASLALSRSVVKDPVTQGSFPASKYWAEKGINLQKAHAAFLNVSGSPTYTPAAGLLLITGLHSNQGSVQTLVFSWIPCT